jgi:hypothetical protein
MNKNKSGTPARKLNSLSVEQKDEIIKFKKSHPHMTQAAIALYFEKEWNELCVRISNQVKKFQKKE